MPGIEEIIDPLEPCVPFQRLKPKAVLVGDPLHLGEGVPHLGIFQLVHIVGPHHLFQRQAVQRFGKESQAVDPGTQTKRASPIK